MLIKAKHQAPYRENTVIALLWLCAITATAIFPFAVYRLLQRSWLIGIVDVLAVTASLSLFIYVYRTRRVELPALIYSIMALIAGYATVVVKGPTQIYWGYTAIMTVFFLLKPRQSLLLNGVFIAAYLPLLWLYLQPFSLATVVITLLSTFGIAYIFALRTYQQERQLIAMATIDPLTGIGNRRGLEEKLSQAITNFRRHHIPASLILIDLDHFKRINDQYGHAQGDLALMKFAEIIRKRVRRDDALFRFGGEEFIILAEGADLSNAQQLAEEIRRTFHSTRIIESETLTLSAGVAQYRDDMSWQEWIRQADHALFEAKEAGRNCVHTRGNVQELMREIGGERGI